MVTNTPDTNAALTDADLTRAVAERQGWCDLEATTYWREDEHDTYEAELWRGTPPKGEDGVFVPDYAADPAVALGLLREMNGFVLRYYAGLLAWTVELYTDTGVAIEYGSAATPARAICLAWLAWRDEQETR